MSVKTIKTFVVVCDWPGCDENALDCDSPAEAIREAKSYAFRFRGLSGKLIAEGKSHGVIIKKSALFCPDHKSNFARYHDWESYAIGVRNNTVANGHRGISR